MANFKKHERQKIIDNYLNETGKNQYVPAEFCAYLKDKPDHPAYSYIYGSDNDEAANKWRVYLATQFVSGLKLVVSEQVITGAESSFVVETKEYPSLISPVKHRKSGGGYHHYDPSSLEDQEELRIQAARSLTAWINKYRSVVQDEGIDLTEMEEIAQFLRGEEKEKRKVNG